MEEILASIRRIIADDAGAAPVRTAPRAVPEPAEDASNISRPSEPLPPQEPAAEADILELTQPVEPAPTASFTPVRGPDVAFREEEPRQEPRPAPPQPAPSPVPQAAAPAPVTPPASDPLLSSQSSHAVAAAFNSLASTVLTENSRTLEDIVKEMLRPMLKHWLDENLPGMVERIVRAEIERVARGGR